jgi:hypothetical protein
LANVFKFDFALILWDKNNELREECKGKKGKSYNGCGVSMASLFLWLKPFQWLTPFLSFRFLWLRRFCACGV